MSAPQTRPRVAPVLLAALLSSACGSGEDPAPTAPSESTSEPSFGTPLQGAAETGSFVARIRPVGGEIPMNEPFAVELALFEADGVTPWIPDEVQLDARMPEHEHGMLRYVELEATGPGTWRAQGLLFHMVGLWQFHVDARSGARIERAALEVVL